MTSHEYRCGNEPKSGLYYEVLAGSRNYGTPLVFIHGGGGTGAAFRRTPDDRPGWADLLAERGFECWVTDWPGTGRSGGRNPIELEYSDVVDGYVNLLCDVIARPAIILCHSMGGPATWAVVEVARDLVAGVLSVAASAPANAPLPPPTILSDDGRYVTVVFGLTGVEFTIDRYGLYVYEDAYIYQQGIANSRQFNRQHVASLRAGLVGMPPKIVLQKIGVIEGFPKIRDERAFAGLPVRVIAGDCDPAHSREVEQRTIELLRSWSADVEMVWLPDRGIRGNGHFIYAENNSDEVLEVVQEQLLDLLDAASAVSLQ
jgi:pimeloyl-ACP methyl ester carboxylesterase